MAVKGVQQIMLGRVTGSEEKARAVLGRIEAAGYEGIELNRFMLHPSGLMVRLMTRAAGMPTGSGGKLDWPRLAAESGLRVISLHTDLGSVEREPEAVAREAAALDTGRVVITGMYRFDYGSEQAVRALAGRLNAAGEGLKARGLRLFYHNHNVELQRVSPRRRAFDVLLEETDPALVEFEFDSYWFTDGGADAGAWMRKLGPRMKLWHIADRGTRLSGPANTPILKADSVELGAGNMPLEELAALARENGVEAVVLESHRNWIGRDPVRSLEVSAPWLTARF